MKKYNIEGNINFYEELFKSLDEDTDDETTLCQITGFMLDSNSVTLECNHKFNYEPLYKEICRQKFQFCTYDTHMMNKNDQIKIRDSNLDYFIKCPYCRNIQFTILPYYEELGLKPRYGINSLDLSLPDNPMNNKHHKPNYYGSDEYKFMLYGKLFKKGQCSFIVNNLQETLCNINPYVTPIENTDKSFCKYHYKTYITQLKNEVKQKKIEEKMKEKEEKMKEKEEKMKEKLAKGLLPLKRFKKQKLQNVVQEPQQIGQYVPETEEQQIIGCKAILKTGPKKGSPCGCIKIYADGLCMRHIPKEPKNDL